MLSTKKSEAIGLSFYVTHSVCDDAAAIIYKSCEVDMPFRPGIFRNLVAVAKVAPVIAVPRKVMVSMKGNLPLLIALAQPATCLQRFTITCTSAAISHFRQITKRS